MLERIRVAVAACRATAVSFLAMVYKATLLLVGPWVLTASPPAVPGQVTNTQLVTAIDNLAKTVRTSQTVDPMLRAMAEAALVSVATYQDPVAHGWATAVTFAAAAGLLAPAYALTWAASGLIGLGLLVWFALTCVWLGTAAALAAEARHA
jgi:hypothetical protein